MSHLRIFDPRANARLVLFKLKTFSVRNSHDAHSKGLLAVVVSYTESAGIMIKMRKLTCQTMGMIEKARG